MAIISIFQSNSPSKVRAKILKDLAAREKRLAAQLEACEAVLAETNYLKMAAQDELNSVHEAKTLYGATDGKL